MSAGQLANPWNSSGLKTIRDASMCEFNGETKKGGNTLIKQRSCLWMEEPDLLTMCSCI